MMVFMPWLWDSRGPASASNSHSLSGVYLVLCVHDLGRGSQVPSRDSPHSTTAPSPRRRAESQLESLHRAGSLLPPRPCLLPAWHAHQSPNGFPVSLLLKKGPSKRSLSETHCNIPQIKHPAASSSCPPEARYE